MIRYFNYHDKNWCREKWRNSKMGSESGRGNLSLLQFLMIEERTEIAYSNSPVEVVLFYLQRVRTTEPKVK